MESIVILDGVLLNTRQHKALRKLKECKPVFKSYLDDQFNTRGKVKEMDFHEWLRSPNKSPCLCTIYEYKYINKLFAIIVPPNS